MKNISSNEVDHKLIKLLEGIARGEKAAERAQTVSHAEAKKRMSRWLRPGNFSGKR
ncbi:MAG: hypothetical protein Q8L95_08215 [Burkholderiales bacterium]|nr:hypothetical protein [Burkholderiales bacterium]